MDGIKSITVIEPDPRGSGGALIPLLKFEWVKMWGRRLTWVPFIVLALISIITVIVCHRLEFTRQRQMLMAFNFLFKGKEFVNGYYVTVYAMNPVFQMLMPIFISVASGIMVAGEAEQGTLRACLIRPITRTRLLLSKFTILFIYCLMMSAFVLLFLFTLGSINFGTGDLYLFERMFNNGNGVVRILAADLPVKLLLAGLVASMGMMVLGSLALMISSLVESAAMCFVLTLATYFVVLALRNFPFLDWLYPYLFVTHMLRWQQCFAEKIDTQELLVSVAYLAGYLIAFLVLAVLLFERKDIKS